MGRTIWVSIQAGARGLSLIPNVQADPVAHPSLLLITYPGVKLLRSEADHSSPSVVEVKNEWSYTTTPPTYLRGVYRGNFKLFIFSMSRDKSLEWKA